jgi:hypothetical protein
LMCAYFIHSAHNSYSRGNQQNLKWADNAQCTQGNDRAV